LQVYLPVIFTSFSYNLLRIRFLFVSGEVEFHINRRDFLFLVKFLTQSVSTLNPLSTMAMFTGNEGEPISLATASEWTANYRDEYPGEIRAHYYGSSILQDIIDQENAVGIRFYYAIDDLGVKQLVLVGVDADGKDITSGIVADRGSPCPTYCDSGDSTLNK
jgi:hypothetical protein